MNTQLIQILQEALLAALLIVIPYSITLFKKFIKQKINNEYINQALEIIEKAVINTNQTYVDSLKDKNMFTKEAQIEAFERAVEIATSIIPIETQQLIDNIYNDFDQWLTIQIETFVNVNKI